jgi:hypothetical protein
MANGLVALGGGRNSSALADKGSCPRIVSSAREAIDDLDPEKSIG